MINLNEIFLSSDISVTINKENTDSIANNVADKIF